MRALQNEHQRLFKFQRRLSARTSAYRHNLESLEQVRADLAQAEAEMAALKEGVSGTAPELRVEQETARGACNSAHVPDLSKETSRDHPVSSPLDDPQDDQSSAWTYKRVELLKSMWLAGESASTIANALGNVSRNAVIGKADWLKLPRTRGPNAPPAFQKSALCASPHPPKVAAADPSPWTPRSVEMLERLWRDGMSARDIAPVLGVSREEVVAKLQALGLALKTRSTEADTAIMDTADAARIEPQAPPAPASVQNALSALSAARKRYYGQD